jgi:predicted RNA binding protein YcfA (HicA-like mRNA interferase family)
MISGREVIAALRRAGFVVARQAGSHVTLVDDQRQRVAVVRLHGGRDISPGSLRSIIKQSGLTVEAFRDLLK